MCTLLPETRSGRGDRWMVWPIRGLCRSDLWNVWSWVSCRLDLRGRLTNRGTFGHVMKRNLAVSLRSTSSPRISIKLQARNLSLPGAIYPTPLAQAGRFKGFSGGGKDLWDIRETVIDREELRRISRMEHLDEIEELRLVLGHYCVAWSGRGCLEGIGLWYYGLWLLVLGTK